MAEDSNQSIRLTAYLFIEQGLMTLESLTDEQDVVVYDKVMDALDSVWFSLTDAERDVINSRGDM